MSPSRIAAPSQVPDLFSLATRRAGQYTAAHANLRARHQAGRAMTGLDQLLIALSYMVHTGTVIGGIWLGWIILCRVIRTLADLF